MDTETIKFSAILIFMSFASRQNLDNIKSKQIGDGQHGTARWATKQEVKKTFTHVPFDVENWRNGFNRPDAQGIIVGCKSVGRKTIALVDESDVHAIMLGAAGVGKTAFFYILTSNMPVHRA